MGADLKYIPIKDYVTFSGYKQDINLSFETFGVPLDEGKPIVFVVHALTGNSTVIGEDGWWNELIGKGKTIDTTKYSILSFNVIGNGYDNKQENLIENYTEFTTKDVGAIFNIGLAKLGVKSIFTGIAGSVGAGVIWEMLALNKSLFQNFIPIASDWKSADWVIGNCYVQDRILNTSNRPIFDARIHAMTTYRTPESFTKKFGRSQRTDGFYNMESWLEHHGVKLEERFTLSAYKMMNQVLRTINVADDLDGFVTKMEGVETFIHMININSDLFFKINETYDTYNTLKSFGFNVKFNTIDSEDGHDAFLIEFEQISNFIYDHFN